MRVRAIVGVAAVLLVAVLVFVPFTAARAQDVPADVPQTQQHVSGMDRQVAAAPAVESGEGFQAPSAALARADVVAPVQRQALPAGGNSDLAVAIGWLFASGAGMAFGGWIVHRIRRSMDL